ncbi:pro-sigmaK processing inhibitor BofA family protein [Methanohalophilus halophilus]|uniref:SigmaK-factor processing regulatory protein BofA n=1 Tax=Methanohalophilus halophilus TaxID=2177 RepID=A0A1L3Q1L5_9EURY|nr:pro-sigmaK processing inhibitor BofA family protein [Methanohalophilus halophilus]APH38764.1 transcriptional regulator [Methanohalophilus halophilus]RNI07957.1 transcriptional regulator [Methanohalophilus halophilus]SDW73731.1 SigmaK-factor processing regulatory protein BofA [Methanohalophilus halophilus]
MVGSEIILVLVALIVALLIYKVLKTVKGLIVNTILGLAIIVGANVIFGLGIAYSAVVILTCAIGGPIGALLVILLNHLGIFF